jgi:hypothetical protein
MESKREKATHIIQTRRNEQLKNTKLDERQKDDVDVEVPANHWANKQKKKGDEEITL